MPDPHPAEPVEQAQPAERALFHALVDDASAMRAGSALDHVLAEHLARGAEGFADLLGPLLLPAARADELVAVKHRRPVRVLLVGPVEDVQPALPRLAADDAVTVAGVQVPWSPGWTQLLGAGVPVSVEVPAGVRAREAVADIGAHTSGKAAVQAALRVDAPAVRDVAALAAALRQAVDLDLGFRVTGELPVARSGGEGLGLLNVLAATRYALAHAAEVPELARWLCHDEQQDVLDVVTRMSQADASVVRAFFTSYDATAPAEAVRELARLRLVEDTV
ncbi:MAG TPA: hypothetical protein VFJ97_09450 [Dermatophilaceae bacterium]|nr:hypothetical protein [Dermatophilaceae bacterium]